MHVLILGGGGFIGKRLTSELLKSGGLSQGEIDSITAVDIFIPDDMPIDSRLESIETDFSDESVVDQLLEPKPDLIFHLAAIVSGEAEKNFDLGMKINFHASLQLLEKCRALGYSPRIVFASSCAVFGGDVSKVIVDDREAKPMSSYGTQKAMVELLVNDYSRRGFVDGRSLRLPTIAIRPGKPNTATSSFVSSIVREPLNGIKATYPVPVDTPVWILSPKRVVQNFIHAANIDGEVIGRNRVINLPGLTTTIEAMISSVEKAAGTDVAGLASYEPDEFLQSIVLTWPPRFSPEKAYDLGFKSDASAEEIIELYIKEEGINIK
ncbi:MAG: SDR family oxidoreductase [Cyclobacteriaceae bacterium]